MNYYLYNSDVTVDLASNSLEVHKTTSESFKVSLIDTGLSTMTAGRLQRVKEHIGNSTFMLTYGDGLADLNIKNLVDFHNSHKKIGTMTSIQPSERFGRVDMTNINQVIKFEEKPEGESGWINGGFFVLEPEVFDYLPSDASAIMWEGSPLKNLAKDGELMAFKHYGFWKCMDHLRDKIQLEQMWESQQPVWKIWE